MRHADRYEWMWNHSMDQSIDWFTPFIVRAREGHKRRAGRQRHRLRCRLRVSHGPSNSTARMGRPLASRAYTGDETQESNGLCNFNPVWMSFGSLILSFILFVVVATLRCLGGRMGQVLRRSKRRALVIDDTLTLPHPSGPSNPEFPSPIQLILLHGSLSLFVSTYTNTWHNWLAWIN